MTIRHWPISERPRERILEQGAASLSNAELLAVLLRTGVRCGTAVDLARDLLALFGGLRGLFSSERGPLLAAPGFGPASYAVIQASMELCRRHLAESLARGPGLTSPKTTRDYLIARLRDRQKEVFCCLFLDNRHRVIRFEELFQGTIDGTSVYPREVVKRALDLNAAATIFAHNHPSGVAEPSQADERITRRLKSALNLVDIRVLDHFIVGDGICTSFAERGLL